VSSYPLPKYKEGDIVNLFLDGDFERYVVAAVYNAPSYLYDLRSPKTGEIHWEGISEPRIVLAPECQYEPLSWWEDISD